MTTLTAKQKTAIELAVKNQYEGDASTDDTASALFSAGVAFSDIEKTILSTAKKLGFILEPAQIIAKIEKAIEGQSKPDHYFDLLDMVKGVNLPQLSFSDLIVCTQELLKTNLKQPTRYNSFSKEANRGKVASWIKDHPDFKPSELLKADPMNGARDCEKFYDEFISYQRFFKDLAK